MGIEVGMKSVKRLITEGIELPNKERIRKIGEKENFKYLGIFKENSTKQPEIKTIKNKNKWVS